MKASNLKQRTRKLSLWVVVVIVLLTFFTFSGSSAYSSPKAAKAISGHLISGQKKASAASILFREKTSHLAIKTPAYRGEERPVIISTAFNLLQTLKFNHTTRQFNSLKIAFCLRQRKTIPQTSDEDLITFLLG
jgi:hypothetical protein